MMFLNFYIWGVWYVTMGTYLKSIKGVTDVQVGIAYGTQSLGAIIAPFIVGLIADKFFAAQKNIRGASSRRCSNFILPDYSQ